MAGYSASRDAADTEHVSYPFLVVSPAYIFDIMDGEVVDSVVKVATGIRVLEGRLSPVPVVSYALGRRIWLVEVIRLR